MSIIAQTMKWDKNKTHQVPPERHRLLAKLLLFLFNTDRLVDSLKVTYLVSQSNHRFPCCVLPLVQLCVIETQYYHVLCFLIVQWRNNPVFQGCFSE